MFSTACGEVIEAACQTLAVPASGPVLAHFHEWMCGGGLLYLKERAPKLGTVFTTHATMLGRSMAGSGFDIYKQMNQINPKWKPGPTTSPPNARWKRRRRGKPIALPR